MLKLECEAFFSSAANCTFWCCDC